MKIVGWRAKVEDRQEWNRIVEQTETHPGLQSEQKEEEEEEEKKKKKKKKNKEEKKKKKMMMMICVCDPISSYNQVHNTYVVFFLPFVRFWARSYS